MIDDAIEEMEVVDDAIEEKEVVIKPGDQTMLQIARMLRLASNCFESHGESARSYLRTAEAIIHRTFPSLKFSVEADCSRKVAKGLAPWQIARAAEYIELRLDEKLNVVRMAREVRLSCSHFSRAFKISFGMSPRRFVTEQRINRAKARLSSSPEPLSHIALTCGFCDQAHFNRCFRRYVGISPGAWRRLNHKEASNTQ